MEPEKLIPVTKAMKKSSAAEKIAFCKAWEQSGLSRSAYCRREGLSLPTFYSWLKQQTSNNKSQADGMKFIAVPVSSKPSRIPRQSTLT